MLMHPIYEILSKIVSYKLLMRYVKRRKVGETIGIRAIVEFKFFVNRFHQKSHIFQPVLLQKVIFLANKLIIFNYFLINISK